MSDRFTSFNASELRARRRLAAIGGVATSLVFAMLIWAKLRLVTDIPRTAYAVPEPVLAEPVPQNELPAHAVTPQAADVHAAAASQ